MCAFPDAFLQWAKTHHKLAISLLALERAAATNASVGHLDEQRRLGLLLHAVSPGQAHKVGELSLIHI